MKSPQSAQNSLPEDMALECVNELGRLVVVLGGDYKTDLLSYRHIIERICAHTARMNEHECVVSLLCVLQEGIDLLLNDISQLTPRRLAFLVRMPDLIKEYFQFPESKMPCSMIVRHMTSNSWIRPLSHDEQITLFECITSKSYQLKNGGKEDVVVNLESIVELQRSKEDCTVLSTINDYIVPSVHQLPNQLVSFHDEISLDDFIVSGSTETCNETSIDDGDGELSNPNGAFEKPNYQASAKTLELVDLVVVELDEVLDFYHSQSQEESRDIETLLEESAMLAENIGNAVGLVGLEGLKVICSDLNAYFKRPGLIQIQSPQNIMSITETWPRLVSSYLRTRFSEDSTYKLLDWFTSKTYLVSCSEEYQKNLLNLLLYPVFNEEEFKHQHETANPEDVDITLPEDVNQELLESLLQDLPVQTEALTHALSSMREDKDLNNVEIAQRVAHTIKGSANVVGIKGLANIAHHLEDILEALSKAQQLPSDELMNVMIEACDCIEAMSDALLGYDEVPSDAFNVMQNVVNWSNKINEYGLDSSKSLNVSNEIQNNNFIDQAESPKRISKEVKENTLRISASLADDLLRLAGENLIAIGRVQDSVKNTLKKQTSLKNHNKVLQQLAFDLEHLIDIQGITNNLNYTNYDENFDSLELDKYHELHTISRRLIEIAADSTALSNDLNQDLSDLHNLVITHGVIQKENQELVLRTRMLPVKTIIPRLKRAIRQVCRLTNKEVDLVVVDNEVYLDSEVINQLMEPLMHLLRNAVDHGIEKSSLRHAANKSKNGNILIKFIRKGDSVDIAISDDGQGLDAQRIFDKAVQLGMVNEGAVLSQDEIYRLILQHGFSTREETTQVSGRGVGLDVVSVKIRELKGVLDIESVPGAGCTFRLNLPISSFSTHALLIRVRKHIYAISGRGVEEIVYPGSGKLIEKEGGLFFESGTQTYNSVYIDSLFNLGEDDRSIERSMRPLLIVRDESGIRRAVLVQNVIDSRHVVVKPLGKYMPRIKGVVGSTILGDGSVAPVIDLPELLIQLSQQSLKTNLLPVNANQVISNRRYILIVDDSLSARRSLVQFVKDLGYDVREARDGMEAISIIDQHQPGLVLVDMEMPRMNGLELTAHIRGNPETAHMPIIMITSRSSDKHRNAAIERGVSFFMVKPFVEDELAQHISVILEA